MDLKTEGSPIVMFIGKKNGTGQKSVKLFSRPVNFGQNISLVKKSVWAKSVKTKSCIVLLLVLQSVF